MAHGYDGSLMVSHRQPIGPCQVQQPWVTLKGGTSWVDVFICRILITLIWCDPECPNLARYYKRWRSVFLKGQPHSHSKGHGPSIPQIFGTLPVRKWFDLQRQILVRQHTWGWVSRGSSRQWQWMLITSWCCRLYDHSQFSFYTGLSAAPAVVS